LHVGNSTARNIVLSSHQQGKLKGMHAMYSVRSNQKKYIEVRRLGEMPETAVSLFSKKKETGGVIIPSINIIRTV
jgi:hypothetical protein